MVCAAGTRSRKRFLCPDLPFCFAHLAVLAAPILARAAKAAALQPFNGHGSMGTGRHEIKCHREDHIDHQHEHTDEPRGSSTAGDQRCCHGCDQHHYHCARPELQIHWLGTKKITEQYQHRGYRQGDLRGTSQRDSYAQVQTVLTPENDEPISAAPPTNATIMKPTNAGVMPNDR